MITRVRIKNFRSLADVDVELGPLTVLVGKNGAGKSAFVDALRFVRDALNTNLAEAVKARRGMEAIRRWSPNESCETEIFLGFTHGYSESETILVDYAFGIASEPNGDYHVSWERGAFSISSARSPIEFYRMGNQWVNFPEPFSAERKPITASESRSLLIPSLRPFASEPVYLNELMMSGYYDIAPPTLRPPQLPAFSESLNDNGDNLASVLRQLCAHEAVKQELLSPLQSVVEGVSDVRVQRVGGYWVTELKHEDIASAGSTNGNVAWFELNRESDGTLRWLALLVALNQRTLPQMIAPRLIALEEPEISLHPRALGILSDELRAAAYRQQILITTQSPDLISRFNAEELRIVERVNGATRIGPLDEIQRETINEELFSAGDLLRIDGLRGEPVVVARGRYA